jgi:hypothetical protein
MALDDARSSVCRSAFLVSPVLNIGFCTSIVHQLGYIDTLQHCDFSTTSRNTCNIVIPSSNQGRVVPLFSVFFTLDLSMYE